MDREVGSGVVNKFALGKAEKSSCHIRANDRKPQGQGLGLGKHVLWLWQ